jgi:tetraacyldisaccharide 4'-kinase
LENVFTRERQPLEFLKDKWVGAVSAIAVPEAFESSLRKLGARVEIRRHFADHHRFTTRDIDRFMHRCVERDMEMIVTTEKDAVRFPRPSSVDVPVYFLRIEVEILKGQEVWNDLIRRLCETEAPTESILRHRGAYAV